MTASLWQFLNLQCRLLFASSDDLNDICGGENYVLFLNRIKSLLDQEKVYWFTGNPDIRKKVFEVISNNRWNQEMYRDLENDIIYRYNEHIAKQDEEQMVYIMEQCNGRHLRPGDYDFDMVIQYISSDFSVLNALCDGESIDDYDAEDVEAFTVYMWQYHFYLFSENPSFLVTLLEKLDKENIKVKLK